ncbi:MAG: orotidine-5'-phosphate decarboxylase [Actinomycetota bacterium]
MTRGPIAVALDAPDLSTMTAWAAAVGPHVSTLKVGLESYLRDGDEAVIAARTASAETTGMPCQLFLDLKLHDIPATVAGAARSVARLAPDFLTVHASGGADMVAAAARELPQTRIVAVTVLTSLTPGDLVRMGLLPPGADANNVRSLAERLAVESVAAGARAIVCSPEEVAGIRAALRDRVPDLAGDTVLITPGVRPAGAELADQRRVATPVEALNRGADLLVIGRPITGAADPAAAAATIAQEIEDDRGR